MACRPLQHFTRQCAAFAVLITGGPCILLADRAPLHNTAMLPCLPRLYTAGEALVVTAEKGSAVIDITVPSRAKHVASTPREGWLLRAATQDFVITKIISTKSNTASSENVTLRARVDALCRSELKAAPCQLLRPRRRALRQRHNAPALWLDAPLPESADINDVDEGDGHVAVATETLRLLGALMALTPHNQCLLRGAGAPIAAALFAMVTTDHDGSSGDSGGGEGAWQAPAMELAEVEEIDPDLVASMR